MLDMSKLPIGKSSILIALVKYKSRLLKIDKLISITEKENFLVITIHPNKIDTVLETLTVQGIAFNYYPTDLSHDIRINRYTKEGNIKTYATPLHSIFVDKYTLEGMSSDEIHRFTHTKPAEHSWNNQDIYGDLYTVKNLLKD